MKKQIKQHPLINIGATTILHKEEILGIFDLDNASTMEDTKRYLGRMEQANRLVTVGNDLPKSFVVATRGKRELVYITTLSGASLAGRWGRQSKYL